MWFANKIAEFGKGLSEGDIVSTGSLTNFFFGDPGDVIDVSLSSWYFGNCRLFKNCPWNL